jgi:PRTRC genetic system protein B
MDKNEQRLASIEIYTGYAEVAVAGANGRLFKVVPIEALASAFTDVTWGTGVLPERTLFCEYQGGKYWLAVYIPPGMTTLQAVRRSYHVPMPGLVFAGKERSYRLFAVKGGEWPTERTSLYRAPLTNVGSGNICMGNAKPPTCEPGTIWEAWAVFREALFTGHNVMDQCTSFDNVMDLWAALEKDKATEFPEQELVYAGLTLGMLAEGGK